jgi:hypothetical protein
VNYSGHVVMTSGEYRTHDGSLAYLLSVAAAFENNLWIVGMSLDDEYLRSHLQRHRNQINRIRWFDAEDKLLAHQQWASVAGVDQIRVTWPEFWSFVAAALGPQVRKAGVMTAWCHVVTAAIGELTGKSSPDPMAPGSRDIPELRELLSRSTARSKATYRSVFEGDEGRQLLPTDFDEKLISEELQTAIRERASLVNEMQKVIAEKEPGDIGDDIRSALEYAKSALPRIRYMNV